MKRPHPNFTLYPLTWLAFSLALGIVFSKYFDPPATVSLIITISFSVAGLVAIRSSYSGLLILAAFFSSGVLLESAELHGVPNDRIRAIYDRGDIDSGEPVEIEGILLGMPEPSVDGSFFRIRANRITHNAVEQHVSGEVRLFASSADGRFDGDYSTMDLHYGTRIRVACNLEREERFLNPGVMSHKAMLDQQGTDATGTIKSPLLIEVVGQERVIMPLGWIFDQRQKLIGDFRQNLSQPTAGVLTASLLGDRYFLERHTADIFREGGTFHVLVISGLHITFMGALILLFLGLFTRNRLWQFIIATLFLWAYTFAVGAEVPVVRASVMFTILAFSRVLSRKGTLLNSLGLCALLILVWRPEDLFTASFQLTFASVAAIVIIAFPLVENLRAIGKWTPTKSQPFPPVVPEWLRRSCEAIYWRGEVWLIETKQQIWSARLFKSAKPRWLLSETRRAIVAYIFEAVLVSLIVQLALLPLTIIYFHRVSVVSMLMNLWVGVFIAFESFAGIVSVMLSHVSSAMALPFIRLTEGFNWLLLAIPGLSVDGGWASFRLPAYTGPAKIVYLLYLTTIAFFGFAIFRWKPFDHRKKSDRMERLVPLAIPLFAVFAAMIIFHPFSSPRPDGRLHIDFLDVGQGDSALVTFPDGETLLVDGGGRRSFRSGEDEEDGGPAFEPDTQRIGEAVVSAFLWEKGYANIDYILATHADADHIQGLTDVARNFGVRQAFFGRTPQVNPNFMELDAILKRRNISNVTVSRGDEFEIGGVTVDVLYPQASESPDEPSDNDHSVVLLFAFGERRILMTGDIERKAESDLLVTPELLAADIVKVPHHGSRTSSTPPFVDAAHPSLAVISVGRRSIFGHPHSDVVERWIGSGAETTTTGERGAISISTDGKDLQISRFVP